MTQKTSPWTFDVRVRERNLKAGSLTEKDVEKYLSSLPDSADQAEAFATAQPALEQPVVEDHGADDDVDAADEGDADEGAGTTGGDVADTGAGVGGGTEGSGF